jgi:hypothetical protein
MKGRAGTNGRWLAAMAGIAVLAGQGACGGGGDERVDPAVLPAGTMLTVSLDQPLTTRLNRVGDTFDATLTEPVKQGGRIVLAAGTSLRGEVQQALSAEEPGGPVLALTITRAVPATAPSFSIEAPPVSIEGTVPTPDPVEASTGSGTGAVGMLPGGTPAGGSDAAQDPAASAEIEVSAGRKFQVSLARATEVGPTTGY